MADEALILSRATVEGVLVLSARGSIDTESMSSFQTEMQQVVAEQPRLVILDFQGVRYTASMTWSVILGAQRRLRQAGGALFIGGLDPLIQSILHVTGLEDVLQIYPTVADAIRAARK